jgi:hypothetical protein
LSAFNILALAPRYNTGSKKDTTGAFQPEARAFLRFVGIGDPVLIDNRTSETDMRRQVLSALADPRICTGGEPVVAFFCHGQSRKIQFGFGLAHADLLAKAIAAGSQRARVVLYACNAGMDVRGAPVGGDGGFADVLRDALCRVGCVDCVVDAHTTAGHTTRNPYVRRFEGRGSPVGGIGGSFIVQPGSALWRKWQAALRDTDLRFEFPFLSIGEIHNRLVSGAA